ncbi:colicin immunity domain-containing protein [Streptomyces sp. NPDC052396]|uniref:colicin immunity domain-containing protein n=1 Tax=Streptomyces sp. NPDC052396 TaxID=3365689 RepID=UPI0037CD3C7E
MISDPASPSLNAAQLTAAALLDHRSFRPEWLAEGPKKAAPLASPQPGINRHLAQRLASGARHTGHTYLLAARLANEDAEASVLQIHPDPDSLLTQLPCQKGNFLLTLPDLSGALLVTGRPYAVIAGTQQFLLHALPEGVEQAVANFHRYARRIGPKDPEVAEASKLFRLHQQAWASGSEVTAGSATAEQLSLMESFAHGTMNGPDFATSWLAARRRALATKERLRTSLESILNDVFYALDNYAPDPALRQADDLTDDQLKSVVHNALAMLDTLEHG